MFSLKNNLSCIIIICILYFIVLLNEVLPHGISLKLSIKKKISVRSEVALEDEIHNFMLYSYEKINNSSNLKCLTFVSDSSQLSSSLISSLSVCKNKKFCETQKLQIEYDGLSFKQSMLSVLEAGYRMRCSAYIIILNNNEILMSFLRKTEEFRIINTRARFFIWYGKNDKKFEEDEIWWKFPNVILFHYKIRRRASGIAFTVREMHWPIGHDSSESRVRIVEFWGREHKFEKNSKKIWYADKTSDLKNITLRVTAVEHPPSVLKYYNRDGEDQYTGTEIEILKVLAKTMNFGVELKDADSITKWGSQKSISANLTSGNITNLLNETKYFEGAIGMLVNGESDIALGSFYILKHYLELFDMSVPLEVLCTSFLTPNPLPRPRYLALILPFNLNLWLLILSIAFIFGPLIIYLLSQNTEKLEKMLEGNLEKKPRNREKEFGTFSERAQVVFLSFRLMTQVALDIWPKYWPLRIFIGAYWIFWLCVTSGYRGAMVSFLTIPLFERPVENMRDLYESKLGIGGWGVELQRIFQSTSKVNSEVRSELISKYEILDDLNEGVERVAEGNFALYDNVKFLKFIRMTKNLTKNGAPSMRLMKQCVVPVHIGFAYQRNSPLTPIINSYIRVFQESGLLKRWSQRVILLTRELNRENENSEENSSDDSDESSSQPSSQNGANKSKKPKVLSLQDLQGAIYLLFLGYLISFVTLIIENVVRKYKDKHKILKKKELIFKSLVMVSRASKINLEKRRKSILAQMNVGIGMKIRQGKKGSGKSIYNDKNFPFYYIE